MLLLFFALAGFKMLISIFLAVLMLDEYKSELFVFFFFFFFCRGRGGWGVPDEVTV